MVENTYFLQITIFTGGDQYWNKKLNNVLIMDSGMSITKQEKFSNGHQSSDADIEFLPS